MNGITFHLPMPPSVNDLKGLNRRQARPYTKAHVLEWRRQCAASLRVQRVGKVEGPFMAVINMERPNKLSDADNRMKALFDILHQEGVTDDDRHCSGFATAWLPKGTDRIFVAIMPTQPIALQFQPSSNDASLGGWFPTDAIAHTSSKEK